MTETGKIMTDREQLIRVLQDEVWPFLEHDPYNPDVFWNGMARQIEHHFAPLAAENAALRAAVLQCNTCGSFDVAALPEGEQSEWSEAMHTTEGEK